MAPNTKPPSGMRDYLPAELRVRDHVMGVVRTVFESYGFAALQTPALERLEILQGKYGEEGDRLIYRVMQRGAKAGEEPDLALRYDLTVPLARVAAEHQAELPKIFKRYQMAPVWRADRPAKGRFREFTQCDIDTIGVGFGLADAETVLVMTDALAALGLVDFEVRLNSRKVLHGLTESFDLGGAGATDVLIVLDKFDKVGWDGVLQELVERGVSLGVARTLAGVLQSPDELRTALGGSAIGAEGLAEVDAVLATAGPLLKGGSVVFTPWLARGLSYYTGPIFEIFVSSSPSAIASGGRYDDLIGMFAGRPIPAVGGSLGIERIIPVAVLPEGAGAAGGALVTVWDGSFTSSSLALAASLRAAGVPAEVYLGKPGKGLRDQLAYASAQGMRWTVIQGPRERDAGEVAVKDLASGEQSTLPQEGLAALLRRV